MEPQSFYGITLSDKDPLAQFEVSDSEEQTVMVRQIVLTEDAKEGEFNVVQVETRVNEKETLKIPIAVLKAGETRALRPNLEFPSSSVVFKLIKGTGPVFINGHICIYGEANEEWNEDEDPEDDYDDDAPPAQTNGKDNANKKK